MEEMKSYSCTVREAWSEKPAFGLMLELRGFPIPIKAVVERSASFDGYHLRVIMNVADRDTNHPTTINIVRPVTSELMDNREYVESFVYNAIRAAVLHELDEAWHVNGFRARDPHRSEYPALTGRVKL